VWEEVRGFLGGLEIIHKTRALSSATRQLPHLPDFVTHQPHIAHVLMKRIFLCLFCIAASIAGSRAH
jgi:hypothetical protein